MISNVVSMVLSVLILGAVLWFAVANASVVTINLIFWDFTASLAVIVGVVFLLGFFLGVLRLAPGILRNRSAVRANKQALIETQKERDALAERSEVLEGQVKQLAPIETKIDE